jgi:glycosyltransferase involved in cell wall biosynthesis
VAPSQFYADLMRQRLDSPDLRIEIMPNGIDLEGYLPPNPSTPPVIGYLARMIREKGLPELVEAFIHLRTALKHPDARLHIAGAATAGDSALIAELKQQLEGAGLSDQVTWSPNISREEKARMLSSLTLFSVPATYPEAFGLYVLEAMASGVPVIQPNASSFPEILSTSHAGLLVPPGDTIALANAWHELLNHPEALHTFREKGRHAAEQSYSVKAMRDRLLDLANKLDEAESRKPD